MKTATVRGHASTVLVVASAVAACAQSWSAGKATGPIDTPAASVSCTPTASSNGQPITDPNGPYGHQTVILRSANGLAFTREATLSYGGVPELAVASDGASRLYVCSGGIVAYRSTDGGRTWAREQTVIGPGLNGHPIVCDPSFVMGAGLFVFKTG